MGKLARELERRVRTPWGRNPPHCPMGLFSTNCDAPNLRVPRAAGSCGRARLLRQNLLRFAEPTRQPKVVPA